MILILRENRGLHRFFSPWRRKAQIPTNTTYESRRTYFGGYAVQRQYKTTMRVTLADNDRMMYENVKL